MKEYVASTSFSFLIAERGPSLDPLLTHVYFILNCISHYFPDRPKVFCILSSFLNVLMESINGYSFYSSRPSSNLPFPRMPSMIPLVMVSPALNSAPAEADPLLH